MNTTKLGQHGSDGMPPLRGPSVEIVTNTLSDGSETFDVRFVRQGEAVLIPMRDEGSAISLCNQISTQIKFGQIL